MEVEVRLIYGLSGCGSGQDVAVWYVDGDGRRGSRDVVEAAIVC